MTELSARHLAAKVQILTRAHARSRTRSDGGCCRADQPAEASRDAASDARKSPRNSDTGHRRRVSFGRGEPVRESGNDFSKLIVSALSIGASDTRYARSA